MIKNGDNVILKFNTYDNELSRYKGKAYIYESMENAIKYCYHNEVCVEYTPVKHSRWIKNWCDTSLIGHEYEECSLCGCQMIDTNVFWDSKFCPRCGARMIKEN